MNYKIVYESSSFYRRIAREKLAGNWIPSVAAVAIYAVIVGIMSFLTSCFFDNRAADFLSSVYFWLVSGPAIVGVMTYFVYQFRDKPRSAVTTFEGFENFGRTFVLGFLSILFILLWTMLFLIPGIIAAYRYSLAPMILRDRPDLTPLQCISESKRMMTGNKLSMFYVDISFIGWLILSVIPYYICSAVIGAVSTMPLFINIVILLIFELPILWVATYFYQTRVVFYHDVISPEKQGFRYQYQAYDGNGNTGNNYQNDGQNDNYQQ